MIGPVILMYLCIPGRYYQSGIEDSEQANDVAHSVEIRPLLISNFSLKNNKQKNRDNSYKKEKKSNPKYWPLSKIKREQKKRRRKKKKKKKKEKKDLF